MWGYMMGRTLVNSVSIDHLENKASQIKHQILDQEFGAQALRMEVSRLMMVVEALRRMLVRKGVMKEREFQQMLMDIDLEDGVQDGMVTERKAQRMKCPSCGRVNHRRTHCYFCVHPLLVQGRVSQREKVCPRCAKRNAPRSQRCLYCGTGLGAPERPR